MVRFLCALVLILGTAELSVAQISPGELSDPHKHLEGMEFCTQCHTIGKALSNDNCLNCHTEIKTRIAAKKGYHSTIGSKECVECHKEHHGRNFTLVRFDKNAFDHTQTGYKLEGKHALLKCVQCHTKGKLSEKDVQSFSDARKSKTLLGLGTACLSCHKDEHRGQFKADCQQCHTMAGWKPASKFSHENAEFKLMGAHQKVDCEKCHKKTLGNGTATQFIHLEFGSCRSCHADPHKGKFKQECAQCHSVESWRQVKQSAFDHNATQFPLKGKHGALKCEQCHPKNPKEKNPNGEFGFHIVRYSACKDCHAEAHAKQFDDRKDRGACNACHTEQGFAGSTFSVSDHDNARFTLMGAHRATPCVKCHQDGKVIAKSTKQFHWNGTIACTTCHTDVHNGQFKERMTKGCETCHSTETWDEVKFSHDLTKFPLKG
ncbi:MAG: cytochrome C, partial [Bacteroidota bacterium]